MTTAKTSFRRTVDWAIDQGITTAIVSHSNAVSRNATACPHGYGKAALLTRDWNLYDTRTLVYCPANLTPEALKAGYEWAYREFYRWGSIASAALQSWHAETSGEALFYASGWKKFEPLWDIMIRAANSHAVTPLLEGVLSRVTRHMLRMKTKLQSKVRLKY